MTQAISTAELDEYLQQVTPALHKRVGCAIFPMQGNVAEWLG